MADEITTEATGAEDAATVETATEATTETDQATEVDAAEVERLRAALKKANGEAEKNRLKLKAVDDEKLSEIEKAQRDAAEATRELATLRTNSLRQQAALDTGLPAKWINRLTGDTLEDLTADANEILADLNKPRKPAPDASQGARANALTEEDALYDSIYGSRKA